MIAWRMRALRLRARLRLRRARSGPGVCIMAGGRPLTIDEQSGQRDRRIVSYLNYRFSPTLKTAVTSLCLILGNCDGVRSHTRATCAIGLQTPLLRRLPSESASKSASAARRRPCAGRGSGPRPSRACGGWCAGVSPGPGARRALLRVRRSGVYVVRQTRAI